METPSEPLAKGGADVSRGGVPLEEIEEESPDGDGTQSIEPASERFSSCYDTSELLSSLDSSGKTQDSSAPIETVEEDVGDNCNCNGNTTTPPSAGREHTAAQINVNLSSFSLASGSLSSSSSFSSAASSSSSLDSSMSSSHSSSAEMYQSCLPPPARDQTEASSLAELITEEEPSPPSRPLLGAPDNTDPEKTQAPAMKSSSDSLSPQRLSSRQSSLDSSSGAKHQSPSPESSLSSSLLASQQMSSTSPPATCPDIRQRESAKKDASMSSASSPPSYLEGGSPSSSMETDTAIAELLARYCQSSSPLTQSSPRRPGHNPGGNLSSFSGSPPFSPPRDRPSASAASVQQQAVRPTARTPSRTTNGGGGASVAFPTYRADGIILPAPEYFEIYTPVSYLPGEGSGECTQSSTSQRSGFLGLTPGTSSLRNSTTSSLSSKSVVSGSVHMKRPSKQFLPSPVPGTAAFLSAYSGRQNMHPGADTPQPTGHALFFPSHCFAGSERQSIASGISNASKTSDVTTVFLSRLKAGGGGHLVPPPSPGDLEGAALEGGSARNSPKEVSAEEVKRLFSSARGTHSSFASQREGRREVEEEEEDADRALSNLSDAHRRFCSAESSHKTTNGEEACALSRDDRGSPKPEKKRSSSTPSHADQQHTRVSVHTAQPSPHVHVDGGGRVPCEDRVEEGSYQPRKLPVKTTQRTLKSYHLNNLLKEPPGEDVRIRSLSTDDPSSKRESTEGNYTRVPSMCCQPLAPTSSQGASVHLTGAVSEASNSSCTSFSFPILPTADAPCSHSSRLAPLPPATIATGGRENGPSSLHTFLNTLLVEEELSQQQQQEEEERRRKASSFPVSVQRTPPSGMVSGTLARILEWTDQEAEEAKNALASVSGEGRSMDNVGEEFFSCVAGKTVRDQHAVSSSSSSFIPGLMLQGPGRHSTPTGPPGRLRDLHRELRQAEGPPGHGGALGSHDKDDDGEGEGTRQIDREALRDVTPFTRRKGSLQNDDLSLSYAQERSRGDIRRKAEPWKDTLVICEENYSFVGSRVHRHLKTPPSDSGEGRLLDESDASFSSSSSSTSIASPSPQQYCHPGGLDPLASMRQSPLVSHPPRALAEPSAHQGYNTGADRDQWANHHGESFDRQTHGSPAVSSRQRPPCLGSSPSPSVPALGQRGTSGEAGSPGTNSASSTGPASQTDSSTVHDDGRVCYYHEGPSGRESRTGISYDSNRNEVCTHISLRGSHTQQPPPPLSAQRCARSRPPHSPPVETSSSCREDELTPPSHTPESKKHVAASPLSPSLSPSSSSGSPSKDPSSDNLPRERAEGAAGTAGVTGASVCAGHQSGLPGGGHSSVSTGPASAGACTPGTKSLEVWGSCADSNGALYVSEEEISQLWKELKYSDDILDYISTVFHRIGEVRSLLLSVASASPSGNLSGNMNFHEPTSTPTRREEVIDGKGLDDFWVAYASLQSTPYPYGLLKSSSLAERASPHPDHPHLHAQFLTRPAVTTELHVECGRLARVLVGRGEGGTDGGVDLVSFTRLVAIMDGETPHSLQSVAGLLRLRLIFLYFSDLHDFSAASRKHGEKSSDRKGADRERCSAEAEGEDGEQDEEEEEEENNSSSWTGGGGGSRIIVWNEWNWEGFKHSLRHTPAVTQGGVAACPDTLLDALAAIGKRGTRRTASFEDFQAMVSKLVVRGTSRLFRISFLRLIETEDGQLLRVPQHPLEKLPYPPPIIRHRIVCCNIPTCPCQAGGVCTTMGPGEQRAIGVGDAGGPNSTGSCRPLTGEPGAPPHPSSSSALVFGGESNSMRGMIDYFSHSPQACQQGGYSEATPRTGMDGGRHAGLVRSLSGVWRSLEPSVHPQNHQASPPPPPVSSSCSSPPPPSLVPHFPQGPPASLACGSSEQEIQRTRRRLLVNHPNGSSAPPVIYARNFLLPADGNQALSHPSSPSPPGYPPAPYPSCALPHMGEGACSKQGTSSSRSICSRGVSSQPGAVRGEGSLLSSQPETQLPYTALALPSSSSLPVPYPAVPPSSRRERMPTSRIYPPVVFQQRARAMSVSSSSSCVHPYHPPPSYLSAQPTPPHDRHSLGGSSVGGVRDPRTVQSGGPDEQSSSLSVHLALHPPNLSAMNDTLAPDASGGFSSLVSAQRPCEIARSSTAASCSPSGGVVPPSHVPSSSSICLLPAGRVGPEPSHRGGPEAGGSCSDGASGGGLPPGYYGCDARVGCPSSLPPGGQVVAEVSYEAKHRKLFENLPLSTSDLTGLPLLYVRRFPPPTPTGAAEQHEGRGGQNGEGSRGPMSVRGEGEEGARDCLPQPVHQYRDEGSEGEEGRGPQQEGENRRTRMRSFSLISRPVSSPSSASMDLFQRENLIHFPLAIQSPQLHHPVVLGPGSHQEANSVLPPGGVYTAGNVMGFSGRDMDFSLHQAGRPQFLGSPVEKRVSASTWRTTLEQKQELLDNRQEDERLCIAITPLKSYGGGEEGFVGDRGREVGGGEAASPYSPSSQSFLTGEATDHPPHGQQLPSSSYYFYYAPCSAPKEAYPPPLQLREQLLLQRRNQAQQQATEMAESRAGLRERTDRLTGSGLSQRPQQSTSSAARECYQEKGGKKHNNTAEGFSARRCLEEERRAEANASTSPAQDCFGSAAFAPEQTIGPFRGLRNEVCPSGLKPAPAERGRDAQHSSYNRISREPETQSSQREGGDRGLISRSSEENVFVLPRCEAYRTPSSHQRLLYAASNTAPAIRMDRNMVRGSTSLPSVLTSSQPREGGGGTETLSTQPAKYPPPPPPTPSSAVRVSSSVSSATSASQQRILPHHRPPPAALCPPSLPLLSSPAPHPPVQQHRRAQHHQAYLGEDEESLRRQLLPWKENRGGQMACHSLPREESTSSRREARGGSASQRVKGEQPAHCADRAAGQDFLQQPAQQELGLQAGPDREGLLNGEESAVSARKSLDYQQIVESLERRMQEKKVEEEDLLLETDAKVKKEGGRHQHEYHHHRQESCTAGKPTDFRGISTLTTTTAPPPYDLLRGPGGNLSADDFFSSVHNNRLLSSTSPFFPSDLFGEGWGEEKGEGKGGGLSSVGQEKDRIHRAEEDESDLSETKGIDKMTSSRDGEKSRRGDEREEGVSEESSRIRRSSLASGLFGTPEGGAREEKVQGGSLVADEAAATSPAAHPTRLQDPSTLAASRLPVSRGPRRIGASDRLDASSLRTHSLIEEQKVSCPQVIESSGNDVGILSSVQKKRSETEIPPVYTPGDDGSPPVPLPPPSVTSNPNVNNKAPGGGQGGGRERGLNSSLFSLPSPSSPPRLVENHYLTEHASMRKAFISSDHSSTKEEGHGREGRGGDQEESVRLKPCLSSSFAPLIRETENKESPSTRQLKGSRPPNLSGDFTPPPVVCHPAKTTTTSAGSSSLSFQNQQKFMKISSCSHRPSPTHSLSKPYPPPLVEKSRLSTPTTRSFSQRTRKEDPAHAPLKHSNPPAVPSEKSTKKKANPAVFHSAFPSHLSTMSSIGRSGESLPEPRPRSRGGEPSYSYPTACPSTSSTSSSSSRIRRLVSRKSQEEDLQQQGECPRFHLPFKEIFSPPPSPSLPPLALVVGTQDSSQGTGDDGAALGRGEPPLPPPPPPPSAASDPRRGNTTTSCGSSSRTSLVKKSDLLGNTQNKPGGGGGGSEGFLLPDVQPSERLPRRMGCGGRSRGGVGAVGDVAGLGEQKREFELSSTSINPEGREKIRDKEASALLPPHPRAGQPLMNKLGDSPRDGKSQPSSRRAQTRRGGDVAELAVFGDTERSGVCRLDDGEDQREVEESCRMKTRLIQTEARPSLESYQQRVQQRFSPGKAVEEGEEVLSPSPSNHMLQSSRSSSPPVSRGGRLPRRPSCSGGVGDGDSPCPALPGCIHGMMFYEDLLSAPQLSIHGEFLPSGSDSNLVAVDLSPQPPGPLPSGQISKRSSRSSSLDEREEEEESSYAPRAEDSANLRPDVPPSKESCLSGPTSDEKNTRGKARAGDEEERSQRDSHVLGPSSSGGGLVEVLCEPQRSSVPVHRRPLSLPPPPPCHSSDQQDDAGRRRPPATPAPTRKEDEGESPEKKEVPENDEGAVCANMTPFSPTRQLAEPLQVDSSRSRSPSKLGEDDSSRLRKAKPDVALETGENLRSDTREEDEKKEDGSSGRRTQTGGLRRSLPRTGCGDNAISSIESSGAVMETAGPFCTPSPLTPGDRDGMPEDREQEREKRAVAMSGLLGGQSDLKEGCSPDIVEEMVLLEQSEEGELPFFSPRVLAADSLPPPPPAPASSSSSSPHCRHHHEVYQQGSCSVDVGSPSKAADAEEASHLPSVSASSHSERRTLSSERKSSFPLTPASLPPIPPLVAKTTSSEASQQCSLSEYFTQTDNHSGCLPVEDPFPPSSTSLPVSSSSERGGAGGAEKNASKTKKSQRESTFLRQERPQKRNEPGDALSFHGRPQRPAAIHHTVDAKAEEEEEETGLVRTLHVERDEKTTQSNLEEEEEGGQRDEGRTRGKPFVDAASVDIPMSTPSPTVLAGGGSHGRGAEEPFEGKEERKPPEEDGADGQDLCYSSPSEDSLRTHSSSGVEGRRRGHTLYYSIQEEKFFSIRVPEDHRSETTSAKPHRAESQRSLGASQQRASRTSSFERVVRDEERDKEPEEEVDPRRSFHPHHPKEKEKGGTKASLDAEDLVQSANLFVGVGGSLSDSDGSGGSHGRHEEKSTTSVDSSSSPTTNIAQTTAAIAAASLLRAVRAAQREETVECLQAGKLAVAAAAATAAASGSAHEDGLSFRRPVWAEGGREGGGVEQNDGKEERERTVSSSSERDLPEDGRMKMPRRQKDACRDALRARSHQGERESRCDDRKAAGDNHTDNRMRTPGTRSGTEEEGSRDFKGKRETTPQSLQQTTKCKVIDGGPDNSQRGEGGGGRRKTSRYQEEEEEEDRTMPVSSEGTTTHLQVAREDAPTMILGAGNGSGKKGVHAEEKSGRKFSTSPLHEDASISSFIQKQEREQQRLQSKGVEETIGGEPLPLGRDSGVGEGEQEFRTCRSLPSSFSRKNDQERGLGGSHYKDAARHAEGCEGKNVSRSAPCFAFEEAGVCSRSGGGTAGVGVPGDADDSLRSCGSTVRYRPHRVEKNTGKREEDSSGRKREGEGGLATVPQQQFTGTLTKTPVVHRGQKPIVDQEENPDYTMLTREEDGRAGGDKTWGKLNVRNLTVSTDDANELEDGVAGKAAYGDGKGGGRLFRLDAERSGDSLYDENGDDDIEDMYQEQRRSHSSSRTHRCLLATGNR